MGAVVWLDEHHLILVREIQRRRRVCMHREMESRGAIIERRVERGEISPLEWLRDELATTEAKLRLTPSRHEDRRIVDERTDWLLLNRLRP